MLPLPAAQLAAGRAGRPARVLRTRPRAPARAAGARRRASCSGRSAGRRSAELSARIDERFGRTRPTSSHVAGRVAGACAATTGAIPRRPGDDPAAPQCCTSPAGRAPGAADSGAGGGDRRQQERERLRHARRRTGLARGLAASGVTVAASHATGSRSPRTRARWRPAAGTIAVLGGGLRRVAARRAARAVRALTPTRLRGRRAAASAAAGAAGRCARASASWWAGRGDGASWRPRSARRSWRPRGWRGRSAVAWRRCPAASPRRWRAAPTRC